MLLKDFSYAARTLFKKPAFTALIIIILALGIGANSAIFSVVNGVLLRPLDYKNPEELIAVWLKLEKASQVELSPDEFDDYQKKNKSFEQLAASERQGFNLTNGDVPLRIEGGAITANLFPMLGATPLLGRNFAPDDDCAGAGPVVILSYGLWQRRFGADQNIVGKIIPLNGIGHTVVGVMPDSFQYPPPMEQSNSTYQLKNELWVPRILEAEKNRNSHNLFAIGRLKENISFEQAKADIALITEQRAQATGDKGVGSNSTLLQEQVTRKIRPALMILLGAVCFVLLIACANVANLLLIKSTSRQKEIAIRSALGATRLQIVRQFLIESLMLSIAGGVLGLLLAYWGNDFLLAISGNNIPRAEQVGIDSKVLIFTALISLVTGIVFGLIPALKSSNVDLNETLKETSRNSSGGGGRLRNGLVITEVALAVVLLIGAGLLIKSFWQLQQVKTGFDATNLLVMETSLPETKYKQSIQQTAFFKEALEKISNTPGVQGVAIVNNPPLSSRRGVDAFLIEGKPEPKTIAETPLADYRSVSADYFRVMNIPVLSGRAFTDSDSENAPLVTIINEATARKYFADENPLGKQLKIKDEWRRIVGVVGNVHQSGQESEASTHLYVPFFQIPQSRMGIVVKTKSDPYGFVTSVRSQINAIDKEQPLYNIQAMEQLLSDSVSQRRLNMLLLGFFASLALLLSVVGIYGVIAYSVAQRTREIGIRVALGAQKKDVLKLVMKQGLLLTLVGTAIGVAVALMATRFLASLVFEVSTNDFYTFAAVSSLTVLVTLLACYLPARRAMKVDPMIALRYE